MFDVAWLGAGAWVSVWVIPSKSIRNHYTERLVRLTCLMGVPLSNIEHGYTSGCVNAQLRWWGCKSVTCVYMYVCVIQLRRSACPYPFLSFPSSLPNSRSHFSHFISFSLPSPLWVSLFTLSFPMPISRSKRPGTGKNCYHRDLGPM